MRVAVAHFDVIPEESLRSTQMALDELLKTLNTPQD
jgi:hypothetical protein